MWCCSVGARVGFRLWPSFPRPFTGATVWASFCHQLPPSSPRTFTGTRGRVTRFGVCGWGVSELATGTVFWSLLCSIHGGVSVALLAPWGSSLFMFHPSAPTRLIPPLLCWDVCPTPLHPSSPLCHGVGRPSPCPFVLGCPSHMLSFVAFVPFSPFALLPWAVHPCAGTSVPNAFSVFSYLGLGTSVFSALVFFPWR